MQSTYCVKKLSFGQVRSDHKITFSDIASENVSGRAQPTIYLWKVARGHLRPKYVLSITLDWIDIETWKCSQCVRLTKTHRLICDMDSFSKHLNLHNLKLSQILKITFQGHQVYVSICFDEKYDATKRNSPTKTVKLFAKNFNVWKGLHSLTSAT